MQITPALSSDLDTILKIQSACYHAIEPESPASMLSKIVISPQSCFTARIDGQISGYLLSLPALLACPPALNEETIELPRNTNCLYLHDLAIHPTARGQGISKKLVQAFFTTAQQQKFKAACLIAIQNSVPFWQKQGFHTVPPSIQLQEKLYGYGEKATYMECHF